MKMVLLDAATLGEDIDLAPIEALGALTVYETTMPSERAERIADAEVIITNKVVIDREAMEAAGALKLICVAATGMNNIDLEAARERGIAVKNVAGYSTSSVVQHTFALALHLIEKMPYYTSYAQGGAWSQSPIFTHLEQPFREIAGKRWGIIGMGAIGRKVAHVAEAFGAEVVYHSTSGTNTEQPYPHLELDALLSRCDIVSIHAPLTERTQGLLDAERLSLLPEGAVLINVGRGGIIDEKALAQRIDQAEIYVGLDVTREEPIPPYNPLLHIHHTERLAMTPHIAWGSIEARRKLVAGIAENIRLFAEGSTPSP
jgi:glycerate dehydrogenase